MAVLGGANTGGVDFCEQQTQPVLGQQSLICAKSEHVRPSGVLRPGVPTPEHQCRGAWVLRCCSRLLQRTARRAAVHCGQPPYTSIREGQTGAALQQVCNAQTYTW